MFFNCSNTRKPHVCVLDEDLGAVVETTDIDDFYSGCYGALTAEFYPYNKNGNRGVAVSLGNVIKTRDGDRLSGASESADSSFGDLY